MPGYNICFQEIWLSGAGLQPLNSRAAKAKVDSGKATLWFPPLSQEQRAGPRQPAVWAYQGGAPAAAFLCLPGNFSSEDAPDGNHPPPQHTAKGPGVLGELPGGGEQTSTPWQLQPVGWPVGWPPLRFPRRWREARIWGAGGRKQLVRSFKPRQLRMTSLPKGNRSESWHPNV